MDLFIELKQQQTVSTFSAIDVTQQVIQHYSSILKNIIRIKQENPEGEGFRRRSGSSVDLLVELAKILDNLSRDIQLIDQNIQGKQRNLEAHNQQIITVLSQATTRCEEAYQGKARSFAMILQDLERLRNLLTEKLSLDSLAIDDNLSKSKGISRPKLGENEIFVYVRLFHREMAKIGTPQASFAWSKPLLESIKQADKHGLAIYSEESLVKKSLKSECYGYATLKINKQQDISEQFPEKQDMALGCPLLTVSDIQTEQMKIFTHREIDYPIIEGRVRLSSH